MPYRICCSKRFRKMHFMNILHNIRFYTKYEAQNTSMLYKIPIFYTKYQQHAVQNTNMLCKIPIFCTKYQYFTQNTNNMLYKIPTCCAKYQYSVQNTNILHKFCTKYQHIENITTWCTKQSRGSRLESTWTSEVESCQIHLPPVSTSKIGFRSCWLWNATTYSTTYSNFQWYLDGNFCPV